MAIDRAKVTKQADAFMAAGKVDRAIDEFLKLLEDKPDDFNLMNRIGDSWLSLKKNAEALDMFKRAALGYERGGFTPKAAAIYKKARRVAPEDVDVADHLAEMYRQTNLIKDAIQVHIEIADLFTKKGLLKRALEEFSKVVDLDPKNLKNKVKLADLYNKEGLKEKAASIYLEVAETLAIEGMHGEAAQVIDRAKSMVQTPQLFLTLSRLCVVQKDLAGAANHLREGLISNLRSPELLEALAEVELQSKQPDRALEALAEVPQLPEKSLPLCERALRELARGGRLEEGLRLFKSIGRELARRGQGEAANRVLTGALAGNMTAEAYLQVAEIAHQSGLKGNRLQALRNALSWAREHNDHTLARTIEEQLQGLGVNPGEAEPARPAPVMEAPTPIAPRETTDVDPVKRMQVQQLVRDAENFVRNRYMDRALEAFGKVLEIDPTEREAINRIADIHTASGVMTRVQMHYVRTAEKLAPLGHRSLALELLDKAEQLFPGSTRVHRRMLGLMDPIPPAAPVISTAIGLPAAAPAPPPPVNNDLDVLIALDLPTSPGKPLPTAMPPAAPSWMAAPPAEELLPIDTLSEALEVPGYTPLAPVVPVSIPAAAPPPVVPSEPAEFNWSEMGEEIPDLDTALPPEFEPLELEPLPFDTSRPPVAPTQVPTLAVPEGSLDFMGGPESFPAPLTYPTTSAAQTSSPASAIDEDLASTLSDIDFQLDYGSPDEAKIEIEQALKAWPDHPELQRRLATAEESLRRLGHQAKPADLGDADSMPSFFDLTDVLGDALLDGEGEEMHDATHVVEKIQTVDELFNAFREGVEEQVRGDDYDTHYNLGIAYKEMMLIEPALEEFKKAMADPERTLECCSMLAICEQSQGNMESAVAWLIKGIEAPGFPPEDGIGLRYDLGEFYQQMGRSDEAREQFLMVQELDPDYREVSQKLA